MSQPGDYGAGDTFAYLSAHGRTVTWTRDTNGVWTADDGRGMTATDEDVRANEPEHWDNATGLT